MRVSTKGRYALRMLLDLAEYGGNDFVPLKDIARRQEISKKYLEQIIPLFNRGDMLLTNRGAQGGYRLARTPDQYTVGEILRLTEGALAPVPCAGKDASQCTRTADCAALPVWQGLYKVINEYLDGITLQDLLNQREPPVNDYVI